MGEENSWIDFLPGMGPLTHWARHYLGREDPSDLLYFRAGPLADSYFTLTPVFTLLLVLLVVIVGALSFRAAVLRGGREAIVPPPRASLRNLFEIIGDAVLDLMSGIMGEQNAVRFLPLIGTLAFFIFFSNILALIPGFIPPTATLKTNIGLALLVFFVTHYEGVKAHGLVNYVKHFMGPLWYLAWLILPIEIIGHLARPLSLSIRLMGNMAADHKVVAAFFALVPLLVPVPFLILGTLVAIVQTLVFCLLSMVYISMAISHDDDHADHETGEPPHHPASAHAHAH